MFVTVQVIMAYDLLQCPFCGIDKEYFDTVPFADENCEYIMCSVCEKLIASVTKCDDVLGMEHRENCTAVSSFSSCNQYDEVASNDQNEDVIDISDVGCDIDPVKDEHVTCSMPSPMSPNHHQMLGNACIAFNFGDQQNVTLAAACSATLDNEELSGDFLKRSRERYCQDLSCSCTSPDSQLLPVEGLKDIFSCSSCCSVHGIDDSMNYYDLLQKGDYVMEACDTCGNNSPHLFLIEAGSTPDSINLRCMKCCGMAEESQSEAGGFMEITEDENESIWDQCIKEWIHYECKCKNSNSELLKICIDDNSSAVFVKCWVCQREDMIALDFKPKVCTCNNSDSVDVRFDEFGYASQLVCLKCHAEMDCGVSSIGDIPAAGDGSSMGRTRIFSVDEIHVGDHIASHQTFGYWHHAIVTKVNGTQICVVHYNGPNLPNKGT